jgi:ketosteroid isomerase-like protein
MGSSRELIEAVYHSFNARDIATVLARMHADVDWPNGMEGGRVHGHSNVRDYWERQWRVVDPHVEPIRIEEDESGRTVMTVHQVVRDLGGRVLVDRDVQHIYSIQDGLIESMEIRELSPN